MHTFMHLTQINPQLCDNYYAGREVLSGVSQASKDTYYHLVLDAEQSSWGFCDLEFKSSTQHFRT